MMCEIREDGESNLIPNDNSVRGEKCNMNHACLLLLFYYSPFHSACKQSSYSYPYSINLIYS